MGAEEAKGREESENVVRKTMANTGTTLIILDVLVRDDGDEVRWVFIMMMTMSMMVYDGWFCLFLF